jgi:hypothetical protein
MNGFNGLVVQTGRSQIYTGFIAPNEHNTWLQYAVGGLGSISIHNWLSCSIEFNRHKKK